MQKKFSKKSKNHLEKSLDGVYKFMALAYHSNWQSRWIGTPHMSKILKAKKYESIAAHQWAAIGLWLNLRRVCPALTALVDNAEIYERLWSHDLGETFLGDVSQSRQVVRGEGKDKHSKERQEIIKMSKSLPKLTSWQIVRWFDQFEGDLSKVNTLPALVAKLVENMQGNHFAMTFGNDFVENKLLIQKIVDRSTIAVIKQLLKVLKNKGEKKAYKEVKIVALHHLQMMNKRGIQLSFKF